MGRREGKNREALLEEFYCPGWGPGYLRKGFFKEAVYELAELFPHISQESLARDVEQALGASYDAERDHLTTRPGAELKRRVPDLGIDGPRSNAAVYVLELVRRWELPEELKKNGDGKKMGV